IGQFCNLVAVQIENPYSVPAGNRQLSFFRIEGQVARQPSCMEAPHRLAGSQIKDLDGFISIRHGAQPAVQTKRRSALGLDVPRRFGARKIPDPQFSTGWKPDGQKLSVRRKENRGTRRAIKPIELLVVGNPANADMALLIYPGVTFELAVEIEVS